MVRKYWRIFRVSLIERMVYRGDFFLGTILRFLPMVTTILLWEAVYDGAKIGTDPSTTEGETVISGFSRKEMIAYLLLVHVSRMFSSMPGLAGGIARDIRQGTLRKYLLQPINLIAYQLAYRAAHKAAYITTAAVPYGIVLLICHDYFDHLPDPATFAAYVVSLLLAFLIGYFFECCIGMVGFWFLEVTSLLYVVNTLNFFVSGHMFPLDLLPGFWFKVLKALPFQYMAYFPASVFLGKIYGPDLVFGMLAEIAWAGFFMLLARHLYKLGLRRYSAYGG